MRDFWRYLGGTVVRPYPTFQRLLADTRHQAFGLGALLLIGVLYTLTVAGLAAAGANISAPAWTAVPPEDYYFWEIFFAAPVFILGCVLAAGLVQLLGKAFRGRGDFESTFAVLAFALTIPSFATWIPETVGTVFFLTGAMTQSEWIEMTGRPGFWQVFASVYQFVALAWYLVLIPAAVAASHRLRWWQTAVTSIITLSVVGTFMFTFIR